MEWRSLINPTSHDHGGTLFLGPVLIPASLLATSTRYSLISRTNMSCANTLETRRLVEQLWYGILLIKFVELEATLVGCFCPCWTISLNTSLCRWVTAPHAECRYPTTISPHVPMSRIDIRIYRICDHNSCVWTSATVLWCHYNVDPYTTSGTWLNLVHLERQ